MDDPTRRTTVQPYTQPTVQPAAQPASSLMQTLSSFGQSPVQPTPLQSTSPELAPYQGTPLQTKMDEANWYTPQREQQVREASIVKRYTLGGAPEVQKLASAMRSGQMTDEQIEAAEFFQQDYFQLRDRYGLGVAQLGSQLGEELGRQQMSEIDTRDTNEKIGDAVRGVTAGTLEALGGTAVMGAAAIDSEFAGALGEASTALADRIREGQTDYRTEAREVNTARREAFDEVNEDRYEQDLAENKNSPEVRRFLREFAFTGGEMLENPAAAGDVVESGVGSLLGIVGGGGIARAIGKKILGSPLSQQAKELATMALIGGMEGGSSYTDAYSTVMSLPHETLMEGSDKYRMLITNGWEQDDARLEIAADAATDAGIKQGIASLAAGKVVARFETDPLNLSGRLIGSQTGRSSRSALANATKDLGGNALREGVEETAQSTTGHLATQTALAENADDSIDPLTGLGHAQVEGAVGGSLTAGVVSTPRVAAGATVDAAQGINMAVDSTIDGLTTVITGVQDRRQDKRDRDAGTDAASVGAALDQVGSSLNDLAAAASSSLNQNTQAAQEATQEATQEAAQGVAPEVTETSTDTPTEATVEEVTEEEPELSDLELALLTAMEIPGEELTTAPTIIREMVGDVEATSRYNLFDQVIRSIVEGKIAGDDVKTVGLWLDEQSKIFDGLSELELETLPDNVVEGIFKIQEAAKIALSNSRVVQARQDAMTMTAEDLGVTDEAAPEDLSTPEGQEAVEKTLALAQTNPTGIDPKLGARLLDQYQQGNLRMSQPLMTRLKNAVALSQALDQAAQQREILAKRTEANLRDQLRQDSGVTGTERRSVRDNIKRVRDHNRVHEEVFNNTVQKEGNTRKIKWGISKYQAEIGKALSAGNIRRAQGYLDRLGNFVQHYHNKVGAAAESAALNRSSDNRVPFRTWTGSRWIEPGEEGASDFYINPNSPASVLTGQHAVIDAMALTLAYNTLVDNYQGQLAGKRMAPPKVPELLKVPSLDQMQAQIAEQQQQIEATESSTTTQEDTQEDTQAPVQEALDLGDKPAVKTPKTSKKKKKGPKISRTRPLIQFLRGQGIKIDPEGTVGQELYARDINPRTAPGLFKRGARKDLDNIPYSEIEEWREIIPNDGEYVDQGALIDAIESEVSGDPSFPQSYLETFEEEDYRSKKRHAQQELARYRREQDLNMSRAEIRDVVEDLTLLDDYDDETIRETIRKRADLTLEYLEDFHGQLEFDFGETASTGGGSGPVRASGSTPAESVVPEAETERGSGEGSEESDAQQDERESVAEQTEQVEETVEGISEEPSEETPEGEVPLKLGSLAVTKGGPNRVQRAYRFVVGRSRLVESERPVALVVDALRNPVDPGLITDLPYSPDAAQLKSLADLVLDTSGKIITKMNQQLRKPAKELSHHKEKVRKGNSQISRKVSPLEAVELAQSGEGKDYLSFGPGKALNFIRTDLEAYDPNLLGTAVLATIHWVMHSPLRENLDDEQIARSFGIKEHEITTEMRQMMRTGLRAETAASALGRTIREFWGVQNQPDAPMSDTIGLAESLGAEILRAADGILVTQEYVSYTHPRTGVKTDFQRFLPMHESTAGTIKDLGGVKDVLADGFTTGVEKQVFIGKPPQEHEDYTPRYKQKGTKINLGSKQRRALDAHRNVEFFMNTVMGRAMQMMGQGLYRAVRGYHQYDEKLTNKNHLESLKGQNTQLDYSWDNTIAHYQRLEAHAEKMGMEPEQIPNFFDWYMISNERIHADGFNPQANKLMREFMMATRTELDLTNPEHVQGFWLTVAQALGVKTEKSTAALNVKEAQRIIEDEFREIVDLIKEGETEGVGRLTTEWRNAFSQLLGDRTLDDKQIHALWAVADLEMTQEAGETTFTHALALEADGKTDGPVHALVHFLSDKFKPQQLKHMAKGGFFIGIKDMTLNRYIGMDGKDLYETGTDDMLKRLEKLLDKAKTRSKRGAAGDQMEALLSLMVDLDTPVLDVRKETDPETGEESIVLGRNTMKNPLTITTYGSGAKGIAGKIARELLDTIYAEMSNALRENRPLDPAIANRLDQLTTSRFYWYAKAQTYVRSGQVKFAGKDVMPSRPRFDDLKEFTFTAPQIEMLTANIHEMFVKPMVESIGIIMGDTGSAMDQMQRGSQIMSRMLMGRFRATVHERLAERRASGDLGPRDFLTQEDYNAVFKELEKYGIIIRDIPGDQFGVDLAKSEPTPSDWSFSSSYDGGFAGNARLRMPTHASVRAAPLMTISRGDAAMMTNFFASGEVDAEIKKKVLAVFDGLEMPADRIKEISTLINKSVDDAWDSNPAMDFYENMLDWLRHHPHGLFEGMAYSADELEGLFEDLYGRNDNTTDMWNELKEKHWKLFLKRHENLGNYIREARSNGAKNPSNAGLRNYARDKGISREQLTAEYNLMLQQEIAPRVNEAFWHLMTNLRNAATSIQARKNVFKRVGYSVDHMASGEAPYVREGTEKVVSGEQDNSGLIFEDDPIGPERFDLGDGIDFEGLTEWLNVLYEDELKKVEAEIPELADMPVQRDYFTIAGRGYEPDSVVQKPVPAFRRKINEIGVQHPGGVTSLSSREVMKLFRGTGSGVSTETMKMVQTLSKQLGKFTIYVGSSKAVTALRNKHAPQWEEQNAGPVKLGQFDPVSGNIYITNEAPETVLHELLHAALTKNLLTYYDSPEALPEVQRTAIENLEGLMGQFMEMDFTVDGPRTSRAVEEVKSQIRTILSQDGVSSRADALNEFIAWTLSNQHLVKALQRSRVRTPLRRLVHDMVQKGLGYIKALLGLPKGRNMDMYSNIAFNAGAVLWDFPPDPTEPTDPPSGPPSSDGSSGSTEDKPRTVRSLSELGSLLNQQTGRAGQTGVSNDRLSRLMQAFERKVTHHLEPQLDVFQEKARQQNDITGVEVVNHVVSNGFGMNSAQRQTFQAILAAFTTTMDLDSAVLRHMQSLYEALVKDLTVEDLMRDPDKDNPADRRHAENQFNLITGDYGVIEDKHGRSTMLGMFLALSQVHPDMRRMLANKPPLKRVSMPSSFDVANQSVDDTLTQSANYLLDKLEEKLVGRSDLNTSARRSLDALTDVLSHIDREAQTEIELRTNDLFNKGDDLGRRGLAKVSDKMVGLAESDRQFFGPDNAFDKQIKNTLKVVGSMLEEGRSKVLAESVSSLVSEASFIPLPLKNLVHEVIGITDSNRPILGMINRVRYAVSAMRENLREKLPVALAEQFSRELDKEEWTALFYGLAKTDVSILFRKRQMRQVLKLLRDDGALAGEIEKLEAQLAKDATRAQLPYYDRKMRQLAHFMVTGEASPADGFLLTNATAIANMLGMVVPGDPQQPRDFARASFVDLIDQLTTLYAIQEFKTQRSSDWEVLNELLQKEENGVSYLIGYLNTLHAMEEKRRGRYSRVELNAYKGYIPSESAPGMRLTIANTADHDYLVQRGYVRVGDHASLDGTTDKKAYYLTTVSDQGTYSQGVLQTVENSGFGVDPKSGITINSTTLGRAPDDSLDLITRNLKNAERGRGRSPKWATDTLRPVFGPDGAVHAYEYLARPDMLEKLDQNTQLHEMIGAWAGRQAEEELAEDVNIELVNKLHRQWEYDKSRGRAGDYVNITQSKDPVHRDMWQMIPRDTRRHIRGMFEDGNFMVRQDVVDNALGFREASVTDFWTGRTRWSKKAQKAFMDTTTAIMGDNAYKYLRQSEAAWEGLISLAKDNIVIRSVVVATSNLYSNFLQLSSNGVPFRTIATGLTSKLAEIDQHLKNIDKRVRLEADLARYRDHPLEVRRIKAQLKALDAADERLSINPLIQAGEFTTISEGIGDVDAALTKGKWADWIKDQAERIPGQFGTVGRYALVARDTALYRGLSRMTQYGDFLAKAVLYDHLTKTKKMTHDDAMKIVTNEFVPYNLLAGRTRSKLERMGLTWFMSFKLRSIKVAHRLLRDHPFRALLMIGGSPVMPELPLVSVGSPITDNAVTAAADGRLPYSFGLNMLKHSPTMNPLVNLFY